MSADASARLAVLVVEDDFLVSMEAAAMAEDADFEVFEVSDADEAIVLLERRARISDTLVSPDSLVDFSAGQAGRNCHAAPKLHDGCVDSGDISYGEVASDLSQGSEG